jgi:hypothetical protein
MWFWNFYRAGVRAGLGAGRDRPYTHRLISRAIHFNADTIHMIRAGSKTVYLWTQLTDGTWRADIKSAKGSTAIKPSV